MKTIGSSAVLLVGNFILHFIGLGLSQSFGIIYSELLTIFDSGKSETSWVASLNSGLFLGCGSVGGILVKHHGCRKVAILGSIIATVGLATSMFVPSMYFLYLTYGFVTGVGMGHLNLASEVSVTVGFDKHRSLAVAIAAMGGGFGTFVLPFLTTFCLEQYGWRGTFLILSGVMLQGVVAGALLNTDFISKKEESESDKKLTEIVKTIFSNVGFILHLISVVFALLAYFIPYIMFPDYAKSKGLSTNEASMVIIVSGISGIVGRLIVGFIADTKYVNRFIISGGLLILGGMSTFGVVYVETMYHWYLVYGAILGIFTGVFAFLQPVLVVDLLGTEHLSVTFGIVLLVEGACVLIGPPIAGWISDLSGRYDESFMYAGIMFATSGLISCFIPLVQCRKSSEKYDMSVHELR